MITLNKYKTLIQDFLDEHFQINTVTFGTKKQLVGNSDLVYPVANLDYINYRSTANTVTHSFEFIIADLIDNDNDASVAEVISDCELIANDILSHFEAVDVELFEINENVSIENFEDDFTDRVAGVVFVVSFTQVRENNACNVPKR